MDHRRSRHVVHVLQRSRLTGWRFFHEASTTLHLAAGGVSPTAKTLAGMVTTSLQVCRR